MSAATLSWEDFLQEATEFQKVAERLGDLWILCKKDDEEGDTYLEYQQKLPNTIDLIKYADPFEDIEESSCSLEIKNEYGTIAQPTSNFLKFEYHIIYSISYQVPVLYFRIYRNNGSLVNLEDAWRLFHSYNTNKPSSAEGISSKQQRDADMLSIMTQMDHPILRKPYISIHPCRTAELLTQAGVSRNRILTFISLMGPYVNLVLRNEYGIAFSD